MIITIANKNLEAAINHKGAELISLKTMSGTEYIWEGNVGFWGKHSPVLFPIVGTLKDNTYIYNGHSYTLPRHGFARDMDFRLIEKKDDLAVFSLCYSEETLEVYPFPFELQLVYTLEEKGLSIGYRVINKGNDPLFFSLGAHPAFALPGNFGDYSIAMDKEEPLEYFLLENDLLSENKGTIAQVGKQFALDYALFKNDALIFKHLQSTGLTLLHKEEPLLKVEFSGFPYLGIWTKADAPFICIEPWFGHSDTTDSNGNLTDKEGIQVLEANSVFEAAFHITIL